ncbi:MAG: DUF1987 domain-containing protein [Bacteroidia bacterium]|nr:DUF1987 domain-containing protein [Bacteroidia bacterium]
MKRLEIKETNNTPNVLFDTEKNIFVIDGKSFPEDSKEFYRPIIEYFESLKGERLNEVILSINLFYLSSSSIISVKQMLIKLSELVENGVKVKIIWSHDDDDDDIKKTGEDYQKITNLPFEFKVN